MRINLNQNVQHPQTDNPWIDLLDIIPDVELTPLISAVVKMKRNEAFLTLSELSAYYDWYIRFDTDIVENLLDSLSDAELDLLASVEQNIQHETALVPSNIDALYQMYSQFKNMTGHTSPGSVSDSDIDFLIAVEEKMQGHGSILTPREMDVYRHWHRHIGILNLFNDDKNHQ